MIAYFDTSAIVPLLIEENGTKRASEMWDRADRVVSVRLAHVETRAALASAARLGRLSRPQHRTSIRAFELLVAQLDLVELDDDLVRRAGDLAESQGLRAYDAVHLASAQRIDGADLVVVAGDRALLTAAGAVGLAVAAIA